MINPKDVITLKIPYPRMSSGLVKKAHMYICKENGSNKKFIKCQSFKPIHLLEDWPPLVCVFENADLSRNPFMNKTTIDCDKIFYLNNVGIPRSLCARRNACQDLFDDILMKINKETPIVHIDTKELLSMNSRLFAISS